MDGVALALEVALPHLLHEGADRVGSSAVRSGIDDGGDQLGHVLRARARIPLERLRDHRSERRRDPDALTRPEVVEARDLQRTNLLLQVAPGPREQPPTGEQLPQQHAEREHVSARVARAGRRLGEGLRSGVGDPVHVRPNHRRPDGGAGDERVGQARPPVGPREHAVRSETAERAQSRLVEPPSLRVERRERLGEVPHQTERHVGRERPSTSARRPEQRAERNCFDVGVDDRHLRALREHLDDGGQERVAHLHRRPGGLGDEVHDRPLRHSGSDAPSEEWAGRTVGRRRSQEPHRPQVARRQVTRELEATNRLG